MARLLLRHADWIYTCDDARRVIQDGYVLIEDSRIAAVGSEPAPAIDADEVVSVAGYVVTPGWSTSTITSTKRTPARCL